jgi:Flp pilus assembly protein TadG
MKRLCGEKGQTKQLGGESGQTLIMVAISLTVLLGIVAFATDLGVLLHQQRQLQTAADAAAVGAATEALTEGNPSTLTTGIWDAAYNDASVDGFTPGSSSGAAGSSSGTTLTITMGTNIPISPFNKLGYVQATVSQTNPTLFMKFFMAATGRSYSGTSVAATAIASDLIGSNGCVFVTNPASYSPAFDLSGNSLALAEKCGISVSGDLDLGSGSAEVEAGYLAVSGSIKNKGTIDGPYAEGVPPPSVPAALTPLETNLPTNINTSNGTCTPPAKSGFTAAQCFVNAPLSGNLNGFYVYTKAPTFGNAQTPAGDAAVIFLDGAFPFAAENYTLNITGPSSGSLSGIVIDAPGSLYQASDNSCQNGNKNDSVNGTIETNFGSSGTTFNGVVYAPDAHLYAQDQGAGTTIVNTDFVVGTICQQSANLEVSGEVANNPITRVGLVY